MDDLAPERSIIRQALRVRNGQWRAIAARHDWAESVPAVFKCDRFGMLAGMTKEQLKAVLDRVLTWPPERQEDAARLLTQMEEAGESRYQLTDEQVAEVSRRLADPNPKFLTLEEVRARFKQRRA
jgi:hypothetical protein